MAEVNINPPKGWVTSAVVAGIVLLVYWTAQRENRGNSGPSLNAGNPIVGSGTVVPQTGDTQPGIYGESPGFATTLYNNLLGGIQSVTSNAADDVDALNGVVQGKRSFF